MDEGLSNAYKKGRAWTVRRIEDSLADGIRGLAPAKSFGTPMEVKSRPALTGAGESSANPS